MSWSLCSQQLVLSPRSTSVHLHCRLFWSACSRMGTWRRGVLSTYWCSLEGSATPDAQSRPPGDAVTTRIANPNEGKRFVAASVCGFQTNGRSRELLRALAEIAAYRNDTRLYFAMVNNEIAGTAALATIDTSDGTVAHLCLVSTLPEYRGRGVQQALIYTRLQDARRLGLGLATVITRVGDGSRTQCGEDRDEGCVYHQDSHSTSGMKLVTRGLPK